MPAKLSSILKCGLILTVNLYSEHDGGGAQTGWRW